MVVSVKHFSSLVLPTLNWATYIGSNTWSKMQLFETNWTERIEANNVSGRLSKIDCIIFEWKNRVGHFFAAPNNSPKNGARKVAIQDSGASFGENDAPYQPISQSVRGLTDAESEETSFAVDSSCANAHRVPAHLVEHHPNAVHLVGFDIDGSGIKITSR